MQSSSNYSWHFFIELEKINPKICMEPYKTSTAEAIFRKKSKVENTTLSDVKICYTVIVIEKCMVPAQKQT